MGNVSQSAAVITTSVIILAKANATARIHVLYAISLAKSSATTQDATKDAVSRALPASKAVLGLALIVDSVKWHVQFHATFYRVHYVATKS